MCHQKKKKKKYLSRYLQMGGSKSGRCQGEGILVRGKGRVKGPEAGCMLDTAKEYHEASVALSTEIVSMGEGCWEQSQKWG